MEEESRGADSELFRAEMRDVRPSRPHNRVVHAKPGPRPIPTQRLEDERAVLIELSRLAFDSDLFAVYWLLQGRYWPVYAAIYVICGLAMFAAAYLIRLRHPRLQRLFSVLCLLELWFLINILIANWFHSANGALNFDFAASRPAENVWYTVAWAVIATGLLILSFLIRWPAARGAALALLIAAVFKCFLIDLPLLGGLYLTASLLGLGLSVAAVGVVLQRRWVGTSIGFDVPA